jgi:hypothetical protein
MIFNSVACVLRASLSFIEQPLSFRISFTILESPLLIYLFRIMFRLFRVLTSEMLGRLLPVFTLLL